MCELRHIVFNLKALGATKKKVMIKLKNSKGKKITTEINKFCKKFLPTTEILTLIFSLDRKYGVK